MDTLLDLREVMRDGDILRIEEIHQQAVMERRGKSSATQPEVLYALMEDRTITTGVGVLPYPHITIIGTTTDEGMLPDAFLNRFALRPHLEPYDTAIGKSRDSKAISLRVEPYLIEQGFIQIGQGRVLTEAGINRAEELL
jgi:Holliday junction resolvasome RuvABC ATP-dependent DNA helicase subunit